MENSINISLLQIAQFITILLTGIIAGLLYGYECSVIKGLGKLENSTYLQSFQSINYTIQNPYFFISFLGPIFVLPFTTWLSSKNQNSTVFLLLLSATIIYIIGVFCITIMANVPLNKLLESFSISTKTKTSISEMREKFEKPWNMYHKIRTIASLFVFGLTILSLLKSNHQ